jgi:hypothetical protein
MYMLGNEAYVIVNWSVGEYKGYVTKIMVPKGNDWLVQLATFGVIPPPAATASPTASPSSQ